MLKSLRFWLLLSVIAVGLTGFAAACGDLEEEECDPAESATCVCEDVDTGESCTQGDDGCECTDSDPGTNNGTGTNNGGTNNGTTAPTGFRYVLIEDQTATVAGDAPGADLDAIGVTTADGVEHFVTSVDDFNIGGAGNGYTNTNDIMGAPDSGCTKTGFVALGGAAADGYITVGFSTGSEEVRFQSGDRITVYELGPTYCTSQPTWDDDPYSVGVSVSDDRSSFTQIGTGGPGQNIITVP